MVAQCGYSYISSSYSFPYPNPTDDAIYIDIEGVIGDVDIEMYDLLGKRVLSFDKTFNYIEDNFKISTINLSSGIYFILIRKDGKIKKKYKISLIK